MVQKRLERFFRARATKLLGLCSTFNFSQLAPQPARTCLSSANVLHHILTSSPDLFHSLTFTPGHSKNSLSTDTKQTANKAKRIRDYRKTDFSANTVQGAFLDDFMVLFYERTVDANWALFEDKFSSLIKTYHPLRIISCKHRAPWLNISHKHLLNRKKRLLASKRPKLNRLDAWSLYRQSNDAFKKAVKSKAGILR